MATVMGRICPCRVAVSGFQICSGDGCCRLPLTVRVVLEAALERHPEHEGNLERGLKRRRVLVLLDCDDCLACDADSIGEFLLRHLPRGPEFSNLIAYSGHQSAFR